MLKRRIIPKLLLKDGRNVKGTQFINLRDTGNPVTNARIYDAQGADELVFLDITSSAEGREILYDTIRRVSEEVFMPFCVGGGVKKVDHIRRLLRAGADKVAINASTIENPDVISEGARMFGNQCIVASIDYRCTPHGTKVFTHGGTRATEVDVRDHAVRMAELGAGEVLLTSIDRDGTMEGYDIETLRSIADAVDVPVIASGGAGTLQHLADAVNDGHASAVAVGSLFHFTDQSPIKARSFMRVRGLEVRA